MRTADNIKRFKALEAKIVANETVTETAKWEQAKLAAEATIEGGMSQRAYADAVGKGKSTIATHVLVWKRWGALAVGQRPRFADATATVNAASDELLSVSDQVRRGRERQVPTRHDDRVEMAEKLLADQTIARAVVAKSTMASRVVEHAVEDKARAQREQLREHREAMDKATARPLSAYMVRMTMKIDEWARDLRFLVNEMPDELEALPEGRDREQIADRLRELITQAERVVAALDPPPADASFIEGRVSGER